MKDSDKIELLRKLLQNSAGYENDTIAQQRADAWNYYFMRVRGDEIDGRSKTVSGDVMASVHANLAQMLNSFSSDSIADFDALGPEDEDNARHESDAVQYFVMKSQNGYVELSKAIHQALLLRNGVMKAWVEEFTQSQTRTFDNVSEDAAVGIALLDGVTIKSYEGRALKVKHTRTLRKFRAEAVQMSNFYYPPLWDSTDLQECPAVFERHVEPRSELVRRGVSKSVAMELPAYSQDRRIDQNAGLPGSTSVPPSQLGDKSLDMIEWYEGYILADVDGDGIAERRCMWFHRVAGKLLRDDPAFYVPYALGVALLNPATVTGISLYDTERQVQDEHTGLKRALYDNVNAVTKNRVAYLDGKVNPDDIGDGRPNGGIRVTADTGVTDVRQAITAFQVPDNSGNILANIESLKRERSEMGGASLDLASANLQIGGDRMGSQGLDRAYSTAEQFAAMMVKNVAVTLIRSLFLISHAALRYGYDKPSPIKVSGKWQTANPQQWQPRDSVTVKIGQSPGERARQAATLRQMLNDQLLLVQNGQEDTLVNAAGFYKTLMHWARVSDVPNPEQYWIDPTSDAAQQAFAQKAAARKADDDARKALMSQAVGLQQLTLAVQKFGQDADRVVKVFDILMRVDETEAKIVGPAAAQALQLARGINDESKGTGEKPAGKPAAGGAAK